MTAATPPARLRLAYRLWTLALLALLGTNCSRQPQDTQLARNLLDAAKLRPPQRRRATGNLPGPFDSSSRRWSPDGLPPTSYGLGAPFVAVRIEDEAGKVNPSIASAGLLQALLQQVGADPVTAATVAASIVEWRMASGVGGRPSAAVARYAAAGRDYAPSGAPFANVSDLGAVIDMTPELLTRLRPHLTVFTDSDPSASTLDPVVAKALAAVGQRNVNVDEIGAELVSVAADARGRPCALRPSRHRAGECATPRSPL